MAEREIRVPQPEFSSACSAIARALATSLPLADVLPYIESRRLPADGPDGL
jgi:hypothetical protein